MEHLQSDIWHNRANQAIIGGVNSPSRSFKAVGGGSPVTMVRGQGAYMIDVDNNQYIDYLCAFGPVIAGHAHPHIEQAVTQAMRDSSLLGTPTIFETLFAERLQKAIPPLERVRFVNSGTEAIMTCIRVARAYTHRSKILKFAGCYHGHSDLVLVAAGSGPSSIGIPDSAGVPESIVQEVITIAFNDESILDEAMRLYGDQIAAILVEPVVGNFGIVEPKPGFLRHIRDKATEYGSLVVYDEVITAFRFRFGAVEHDVTTADLYALGKIIGGGLPIGAYGGRQSIMEQVAPLGPAYQAGTLAGNPASLRAGMACLDLLERPGTYETMQGLAITLTNGISWIAKQNGVPITINEYKGAFTVYFNVPFVQNYEHAKSSDSEMFSAFFHAMLAQGVYLAPSKYEAWFLTIAHTKDDIEKTLEAVEKSMPVVRSLLDHRR